MHTCTGVHTTKTDKSIGPVLFDIRSSAARRRWDPANAAEVAEVARAAMASDGREPPQIRFIDSMPSGFGDQVGYSLPLE